MKSHRTIGLLLLSFHLLLPCLLHADLTNSTPDSQFQQRLEQLAPKVTALSEVGISGQVRAMLAVALERAKACLDAGDAKDAADLLNDVESALAKNTDILVAPSSQTNMTVSYTHLTLPTNREV